MGFAAALGIAVLVDDERTIAYLIGIAAFFLIAVLGALRAALRRVEGETAPLSATAVIAGSAAAALYLVLAAAYAGLAQVEGEAAADVGQFAFAASFPQAALLASAGTVIVRTHVAPPALGVAAQALAPLQLAAPLVVLSSESDLAIGLAIAPFALWMAAAGILLLRAEMRERGAIRR